jgi:hypothetical protein
MALRDVFKRPWSDWAALALGVSFVASILLSVADGLAADAWLNNTHDHLLTMAKTWITDFRYLADQIIYASIILLVGSKFFEARTVLTIGFDKLDAKRMAVLGPDEEGFIWVGRKYNTRFEGEAVVAALKSRIRDSA